MAAVTGANLGVKHGWDAVTHESGWGDDMNANLRRMDALIQLRVTNQTTATPPGSPADWDRYIIGASATGVWATHEKKVAVYHSAGVVTPAWAIYTPKIGWVAYVSAETKFYYYDGTNWVNPLP